MPEFSLRSSMPLRVSLVNLQKFTLCAWLAPASMRILAPAENTRGLAERSTSTRTSGCSNSKPLDRVCEFNIDAEIVGIELEVVAFEQRRFFVDVHHQGGDFAIDLEPPVAIA